TTKMIRRHPHVFGDAEARDKGMAKGAWDRTKQEEEAEKRARRLARGLSAEEGGDGYLDGIPFNLPALTRALKIQQKASRVGFDWGAAEPILAKIEEEIAEFREAMASGEQSKQEDEFGDVLFSVVNLGRHLGLDAEKALTGTNAKFRQRFHFIEQNVVDSGSSLEEASLDEMEVLWEKAKA